MCQVKILDFKRRFLDAAFKYYELSMNVFDKEEVNHCLIQSVLCVVLAGASNSRLKLLATLFKDERIQVLSVFPILDTVYHMKLVKPFLSEQFEQLLRPHQKASLGNNLTVSRMAILSHNLQVVSHFYSTIYLSELGRFLDLTSDQV